MGRVRGIIFDMDGTLIVQELDFAAMRREIGLPPDTPLLEALAAMSEAERRTGCRLPAAPSLDDH